MPCLDGYYQNAATGLCTQCPSGKICNYTSAMTLAQASVYGLSCPLGYYPSGLGCAALAQDQSFTDGQTLPATCAANQYVASPGAACATCPSGFACLQIPCPAGSPDPTACTPCPAGLSLCSQATINISPILCPLGYYTSASACLICPEGSACPDQTAAVACAVKTYSG